MNWKLMVWPDLDDSDGNESDPPETAEEKVEKILGASARRDKLASDLVKKARLTDDQVWPVACTAMSPAPLNGKSMFIFWL